MNSISLHCIWQTCSCFVSGSAIQLTSRKKVEAWPRRIERGGAIQSHGNAATARTSSALRDSVGDRSQLSTSSVLVQFRLFFIFISMCFYHCSTKELSEKKSVIQKLVQYRVRTSGMWNCDSTRTCSPIFFSSLLFHRFFFISLWFKYFSIQLFMN